MAGAAPSPSRFIVQAGLLSTSSYSSTRRDPPILRPARFFIPPVDRCPSTKPCQGEPLGRLYFNHMLVSLFNELKKENRVPTRSRSDRVSFFTSPDPRGLSLP